MEPIQIIGIIFVAFFLIKSIFKYKEGIISLRELFFWGAVWAGMLLVVINTHWIKVLSASLGVGRGIDLVVYVSIILLFYLVFRIFVKMHKLDRDITKIVREIAKDKGKK